MNFKSRLLFYFGTVIILPVLVVLIFSQAYLREGLERDLDNRLHEGLAGITGNFDELRASMLARLRAVSVDAEMAAYLAIGDRQPLLGHLQQLVSEGAFTLTEVGDTDGRVIARGHNPGAWGENKRDYPLVAAALAGRTVADFEEGRSGLAIRAIRPLTRDGKLLGTLTAGYSLDERLAHQFRLLTGLETGFIFEGRTVATVPALAELPPGITAGGRIRERTLVTVTLAGREYRIALQPITRSDGSRLGVIAVGRELADATRFASHLRNLLLLVALLGLFLALLAARLLARGFSRPVEELQARMEELGGGRLEVRLPPGGADEFGALAGDFNRMAGRLQALTGELARTQSELVRREKLAAAGRLIIEIAHEVRNPLNSLAAQAELLKKDLAAGDRGHGGERLALINDEIRRLNELVSSSLRSLAPFSVAPRRGEPAALLRRALDFTAGERAARRLALDLRLPLEKVMMDFDPELFYRVVLNLLANAAEAMPTGGTFTVTLARDGPRVRLAVGDTGRGMTREEQERAFEPYFTTKPGGTGLGLAFVLRVVEAHGGTVALTSDTGRGTEVILNFPAGEKL